MLVGENSTGKTTFLGCYSVLHRALSPWRDSSPDFNHKPFNMGSFRDIVRSRRGPAGRINEFRIGFRSSRPPAGFPPYDLIATFTEEGSQPTISAYTYRFDDGSLLLAKSAPEGRTVLATEEDEVPLDVPWAVAPQLLSAPTEVSWLTERFPEAKPITDLLDRLAKSARTRSRPEPWSHFGVPLASTAEVVPTAPLRAKPQRTYDPVTESATPEGEHIPMFMMRLNRTQLDRWKDLQRSLVDFGRESGLFSDIKIKRHGKQISDPFQLEIKVHSSSHHNITDVGYGVSQSLPILVDLLSVERTAESRQYPSISGERTFMLQQPEVHLHPRGQAALASLLVEFLALSRKRRRRHRVLIETHSDYILDRLRISVRKKRIKPGDVSILYFEPDGNSVKIYNIGVDSHGNLKGEPSTYRDFFVRESDSFLGLDES
ncbi:MAG: AAA family ATPase [Holophagales bacterium]|nr:AAA family ATPase [Holophagales bacterium]